MFKLYKMFDIAENTGNFLPKEFRYHIFSHNGSDRCRKSLIQLKDKCKFQEIVKCVYPKCDISQNSDIVEKNCRTINVNEGKEDIEYFKDLCLKPNEYISIDITGFPIPDLFRLFYVLFHYVKLNKIYVFYTEPQCYVFQHDDYKEFNYLSGEMTYRTIDYYNCTGDETNEVLVIFLGFDHYTSNYVYEKAQPSRVLVVNGFPSYFPKLKDISLLNNHEVLIDNVDEDSKFFCSANNPFKTFNTIIDIRKKFEKYLLNFCVLGTKPMALGVCMYSLFYPENVKVTYPYPKSYSTGTDKLTSKTWCYIIDMKQD